MRALNRSCLALTIQHTTSMSTVRHVAGSLSLAVALHTGSVAAVRAQPPVTPPELTAAQAALRAGNADSAVRTLEAFYVRNPTVQTGRLLLGNAYRQKGDLDKALTTFLAIAQPANARIQAQFGAAGIYAVQRKHDDALKMLAGLKLTGAFDVELARTSPDFKDLIADPRFAATMFNPGDFKNPFVEPVKILQEWRGETRGDQFSWIARGIGDVDGDGASEVVTSAPTFAPTTRATGNGKVYVYSGRSGKLLWAQVGDSGAALGAGLEGAGDVNRDGISDVIAGAPGVGRAYVYSGRDGRVLLTLRSDTTQEAFGRSAAGAGDQNGDGYQDVIVGAPLSNAAGQGAGRAYVFSGKDGAVLHRFDGERAGDAFGSIVAGVKHGKATPLLVGAPTAGPRTSGRVYAFDGGTFRSKFVIESDTTGGALGAMFTSIVGDVNGDKVPDMYAADFTNAAKGQQTGRIYVHSGVDGKRIMTLTGEQPGNMFGVGSADVGDVNKDGFDDLLLGAWQFAGAAQSGGKIYLYSGKDASLMRTITGRVAGETLGFDAAGVGDVNGDGVPDFLVTSSYSNINGFRSGRMFIISGK